MTKATSDAELFYIQHRGYCGDCLMWWRIDAKGYTSDLDEAWKVSAEHAASICCSRPREDMAWPVCQIDAVASRHVNSERFRSDMVSPAQTESSDATVTSNQNKKDSEQE